MPNALSHTQREHAEIALKTSASELKTLAQAVGCPTSHMRRMKANLERFGVVVRPKFVAQGRPRKVTPAIEQVSVAQLCNDREY